MAHPNKSRPSGVVMEDDIAGATTSQSETQKRCIDATPAKFSFRGVCATVMPSVRYRATTPSVRAAAADDHQWSADTCRQAREENRSGVEHASRTDGGAFARCRRSLAALCGWEGRLRGHDAGQLATRGTERQERSDKQIQRYRRITRLHLRDPGLARPKPLREARLRQVSTPTPLPQTDRQSNLDLDVRRLLSAQAQKLLRRPDSPPARFQASSFLFTHGRTPSASGYTRQ